MKRTGIPLHIQIRNEMISYFSNFEHYSPLPSERELCTIFNVSRPTIRKSLETLEMENVIIRIQGKGTFYLGNKVPIDYSDSNHNGLGLSSILNSFGKFTKNRVLQQAIEFPESDVTVYLNLSKNDMVFHLKRLRYVNDDLYSLADDYIPLKICPNLIDIDFTTHNLFTTLEENNVIPYKEDINIEIRKADIKEATYLNLKENDPISVTRIITYDKEGSIIQYATSKSDAYKSRFRMITTKEE
jgi:DNA-binding GntR family transcriptional regulator